MLVRPLSDATCVRDVGSLGVVGVGNGSVDRIFDECERVGVEALLRWHFTRTDWARTELEVALRQITRLDGGRQEIDPTGSNAVPLTLWWAVRTDSNSTMDPGE